MLFTTHIISCNKEEPIHYDVWLLFCNHVHSRELNRDISLLSQPYVGNADGK